MSKNTQKMTKKVKYWLWNFFSYYLLKINVFDGVEITNVMLVKLFHVSLIYKGFP